MFATKVVLVSTFVASSLAIPSVIGGHKHRSVPAQFKRDYAKDADLLEPYEAYHTRYTEFECKDHHGTPFFDLCCHPLLKENADKEFDDSCYQYCEEDDEPVTSAIAVTQSAERAHTSAAPPANVEQPETTSYVAPKPTTTKAPAPAPTTKKAAPPQPTTSAASAPTSGGSWNSGGQATFFYQGGNPGACGNYHSDSDKIIAIDHIRYGSDSERSSTCGRQIEIVNTSNGKSVVATVADDCPSCQGDNAMNSLDLSIGAFTALGDESEGVLPIKWRFIS